MYRKLFFVMSLVCLLGLFNSTSAYDRLWNSSAADANDWTTADNWDVYPVNGDVAFVTTNATPTQNPNIRAGDTVPSTGALSHIVIGGLGSTDTPTLIIEGGDIYTNWFNVSWAGLTSYSSEVYMSDGHLHVISAGDFGHLAVGIGGGSALFVQSGGIVDCNVAVVDMDGIKDSQLDLEGDAEMNVDLRIHVRAQGTVNVAGTATLKVATIDEYDGQINIEENGTLMIAGDVITELEGIWSDCVVAYEGAHALLYDYNVTNAGYTTITACELASDLDGDCDVDFFDFALMADNWEEDLGF